MKSHTRSGLIALALAALSSINLQLSTARAQGTAFSYQGQLNDGGSPAAGTYNLTFALFDTNADGVAIAGPVTNNAVSITNGLFTVLIDFGPGVFIGATNWLEIGVATNGVSSFTTLTPRQGLTPVPYAIYSESAGGIPGLTVQLDANGTNGAPNLIGGSSLNFVASGVVGATIGGGGATNFLNISYSNSITGDFGTIGGGLDNTAVNNYSTVAGGIGNSAGGGGAAVGGGAYNYAGGLYSAVGGGFGNNATGAGAFIGGGGFDGSTYQGNQTAGNASVIGGGMGNNINAGADYSAIVSGQNSVVDVGSYNSVVAGGAGNWIGANTVYSFIGGGQNNSMRFSGSGEGNVIGGGENNGMSDTNGFYIADSVISGGNGNQVQGYSDTIGGGNGNYATNSYSTVGGGIDNVASGMSATVAGGGQGFIAVAVAGAKGVRPAAGGGEGGNTASGDYSFVGGGRHNTASGYISTVAGGDGNTASLDDTAIGGGWGNTAANDDATISGGDNNQAYGQASVISGGEYNTTMNSGDHSTIGGGQNNTTLNSSSTVGGGDGNLANGNSSTVAGGSQNWAYGDNGTTGGGYNNVDYGEGDTLAGGENNSSGGGNYSTISGGVNNNSSGSYAVIGGGQNNFVNDAYTTIGGGANNTATNDFTVVSGGTNNVSGGYASAVAGGSDNEALGDYSFAAGWNAQVTNSGAFVWADASGYPFASTTTNEFSARATGGVRFVTAVDGSGNPTAGVSLAPGDTSWAVISDRNAKKDFAPVDTEAVLDKLAAVPVEQWHYKWEAGNSTPNLGPMAQDFVHAFYPGRNDKSITTLEFDGVELAAIQGLNQKLNEKDAEIQSLQQRLERLEKTVANLNEKH